MSLVQEDRNVKDTGTTADDSLTLAAGVIGKPDTRTEMVVDGAESGTRIVWVLNRVSRKLLHNGLDIGRDFALAAKHLHAAFGIRGTLAIILIVTGSLQLVPYTKIQCEPIIHAPVVLEVPRKVP